MLEEVRIGILHENFEQGSRSGCHICLKLIISTLQYIPPLIMAKGLHPAIEIGSIKIAVGFWFLQVVRRCVFRLHQSSLRDGRRRWAVRSRPLRGNLNSIGEELHRPIASYITLSKLGHGSVQTAKREWLYAHKDTYMYVCMRMYVCI